MLEKMQSVKHCQALALALLKWQDVVTVIEKMIKQNILAVFFFPEAKTVAVLPFSTLESGSFSETSKS